MSPRRRRSGCRRWQSLPRATLSNCRPPSARPTATSPPTTRPSGAARSADRRKEDPMTPPRSDGFVRMPDAEFEAILTRAAEEGAKRALADVGLDGDEAALDIRDL